ncbi:outer-membrane lipoprotein carrier protein LolA [Pararhizobium mangrovi]|uniref:Outer membrane lipoprotein carrier protein LolA n=1 Tax=Pararhizobium mangrovi TaxID=2590452 RepID=A0A506U409_9HYPH|nr:outer-membrane lipoprotein carrier protein LolA [Pararhizobium mangrovi]TPW27745.1 outer membrane lipoprotein carrier protein LolA [Pararhizobium mangrovi]
MHSSSLTPRRALASLTVGFFTLVLALAAAPGAWAASGDQVAQRIANHFSQVRTMDGNFVQIGPNGEQSGGKFYIERPGKIRFDYDKSSPLKVLSNGSTVAIGNTRLKSWQTYPLSQTPLKLLLGRKIDLSGDMVKSVDVAPDLITVKLGDPSVFGDKTITMMFDPDSYDLKQWTITDEQGNDTTVMIYDTRNGVNLSSSLFQLPDAASSRGRSMRQ